MRGNGVTSISNIVVVTLQNVMFLYQFVRYLVNILAMINVSIVIYVLQLFLSQCIDYQAAFVLRPAPNILNQAPKEKEVVFLSILSTSHKLLL